MVSIDIYMNETTRLADVILPPTGPLERPHYDLAFNVLAIRDVANYSPPLFDKPAGAKHDWEILAALEERVAEDQSLKAKASRAARRTLGPDGILDYALRTGPYGEKWRLWDKSGMTLRRLKDKRAEPAAL